jgi:hypothetical protein
MKPLKCCCNGDGRPVCAPSKVLCKECLEALDKKINETFGKFFKTAPDITNRRART